MPTNPIDNVFEFRGVEDLYYAEVTEDSEDNYTTMTPKRLSYTATISKEVESSSETHHYDNKGMIIINAKGAETITLTVAPLKLETLAHITGQDFDDSTGMLIEGPTKTKTFAIGYKTKGTDGYLRFVWRLKGQFAIPSEEVNTESDSIDTTNTELTFTVISTIHKFTYKTSINGGTVTDNHEQSVTAVTIDERYAPDQKLLDGWVDEVQTPETVQNIVVNP